MEEKKDFTVVYMIEEEIVHEEHYDNLNDACAAAQCLDCTAFKEEDPVCETDDGKSFEPSLFAGVRDENSTWLYWLNSEGDVGSDYSGDDNEITEVINKYME